MTAKPSLPSLFALIGVAALFALSSTPLRAHPHVWIDAVSDILFNKDGHMIGLKQSWVFDESYSVLAVQGLDKNRDGKLSRKELAVLLKQSISSLKGWDYFSYVQVNGRNMALQKMRHPHISYKNDKVHISFRLYLDSPVDARRNRISFSVYDRSFYNLLSYVEKDPVWLGKFAPQSCSFSIMPARRGDRDTATINDNYIDSLGENVNYGAQFAEWVELDCKGG